MHTHQWSTLAGSSEADHQRRSIERLATVDAARARPRPMGLGPAQRVARLLLLFALRGSRDTPVVLREKGGVGGQSYEGVAWPIPNVCFRRESRRSFWEMHE